MDDNELLKDKFQQLHAVVVGQNLSTVVDLLFAAKVISAENMEDLRQWSGGAGWSSDQSRRLMTLLHRSGHPRAFTELRHALGEDDSTKWIVEKLDELAVDDELAHKEADSVQCQCPNCGHAYQPAPTTTGQTTLIRLLLACPLCFLSCEFL